MVLKFAICWQFCFLSKKTIKIHLSFSLHFWHYDEERREFRRSSQILCPIGNFNFTKFFVIIISCKT